MASASVVSQENSSARRITAEDKSDQASVDKKTEIKLYPNPFVETAKIFVPGKAGETVILILSDMTGHEIANEWIEWGADVASGAYILQVTKRDGIVSLRIVKK